MIRRVNLGRSELHEIAFHQQISRDDKNKMTLLISFAYFSVTRWPKYEITENKRSVTIVKINPLRMPYVKKDNIVTITRQIHVDLFTQTANDCLHALWHDSCWNHVQLVSLHFEFEL